MLLIFVFTCIIIGKNKGFVKKEMLLWCYEFNIWLFFGLSGKISREYYRNKA